MGMNINQLETLSIFYIPSPPTNRPLENRMLQNAQYKNNYINTLCSFISADFDTTYLYHQIDSLANIIRPYVYADPNKFFSNTAFETNIYNNTGPNPGLKSFIQNRRNSVVSELAANGCLLTVPSLEENNSIQLYPNFANNLLYLKFTHLNKAEKYTMTILDITGKTVKLLSFDSTPSDDTFIIDIHDLEDGIYLLNISTDTSSYRAQSKICIIK